MPHHASETFAAGSWIGRPLKRREDLKFIQGHGGYVDDFVLPGMAHLVVVRSPHAHARIKRVATDAARRAAGVVAVVTAQDLAGVQPMPQNPLKNDFLAPVPHPVLARERVRYVGEPVAAVLAETRTAAEDAAALIEVEYEPLPAVSTPRQALEGTVLLHETLPDNVVVRMKRGAGDVDAAFAAAKRVVRGSFHIPRVVPAPMEPRGAVAAYDPAADLLTLRPSAQDPYRPRAQLSRVLGRPEDRIRVVVPDVGGAFGSKGNLAPEAALAAWLAIKAGRPVKWMEDRRENFTASTHGRGVDAEVEMAVEPDGKITALRGTAVADVGAYLFATSPTPCSRVVDLLTGAYDIPVARVEIAGVATNKVPTAPYRGAGRPEATYLIERMVDLVARDLGLDPVAVRRRNLIPPDRFPYTSALGTVYDSGDYGPTLDKALELSEYERWRERQRKARGEGRLIGCGIAVYVEPAGGSGAMLWESAAVLVQRDGRVILRTGSTAHGQGHDITFSQIAAEVLRVPLEAITLQQGDTDLMPKGVGTFGSRSVAAGGSALLGELSKVKAKMQKIAAHLLEAAEGDIQWDDGRLSVRGAPARAVTFPDVAAAAYRSERLPAGMEPGLESSGTFSLPGQTYPFGAYVVVVEIERETGEIRILKFVAVDDAGRIINPLLAEGQVIGAIVQGLGQALVEEAVYDDAGQLVTGTFADYGMLHAAHTPAVIAEFTETLSPYNPLGAKGVGEAGAVGAPPAFANAVIDALTPLGIRSVDLPLTGEKIWRLMRDSNNR